VWDPDGEHPPLPLRPDEGDYFAFAVRSDERLVIARSDGVVVERSMSGGPEREIFRRNARIEDLTLGPDGKILVLTSGRLLLTWDTTSNHLSQPSVLPGSPHCIRRLSDGRIVLGLQDGTICSYFGDGDERGQAWSARWDDHEGEVVEIACLDDGRIASLDSSGAVVVRPSNKPEDVVIVHEHDQKVICLQALPGGWLASASEDGTVVLVKPETKQKTLLPIDQPIRELRLTKHHPVQSPCLMAVLERGPVLFLIREEK
jgi:WD40 repeat protein